MSADAPGVAARSAADVPADRALEVADLLRSRRSRLQPADVGLPSGARRRTPGLRREEIAQLAGISATYYTFPEKAADRAARTILIEWEAEASAQLARFRAAAARHPDDAEFLSLIGRPHAGSPEVRAWWPRHDVAPLSSGTKWIHHATLGDLEFQHVVLQLADNPEQKLVTFTTKHHDQARLVQMLAAGS